MGSGGSSIPVQLLPQPEPICATEPRFCLPQAVQLRLREKMMTFSGDDFKVTDAASGVVYFQCEGKAFSLREKKVLRDNAGIAVLNMKEKMFSIRDKFKVYAGEDSSREICQFNSQINFIKAKLSAQFTDLVTQKSRKVVLKGSWREKNCVIYLGEPSEGGVPLARIYRPTSGRSLMFGVDDYYMEIAAGVDIALMVIMCIALDEHQRDN